MSHKLYRARQLSAKWKEFDGEFLRMREAAPPCTQKLMQPDRPAKGKA